MTTQRKYITGASSDYNSFNTLDLKNNGTLLLTHTNLDFTATSLFLQDSSKVGTVCIRLNNNFDTLWTKIIPFFSITDCILNSSNEIIIVGNKITRLNSPFYKSDFEILKLDLDGNILLSKNIIGSIVNVNNSSTNNLFLSSIFEYKNNCYIASLNGNFIGLNVLKIDNDFNIIIQKSINNFQNLFFLNKLSKKGNDEFIIYPKNISEFIYSVGNSIANFLVLDTNLNVTKNISIINGADRFFIKDIIVSNNSLFIGGQMFSNKLISNQFDTLSYQHHFLTKIDLNSPLSNYFKFKAFKSNYNAKGLQDLSKYYLYQNKIYSTIYSSGYYGGYSLTINDSLNRSFRFKLLKFDTSLNLVWNKRLHIYGTSDTSNFQNFNPSYNAGHYLVNDNQNLEFKNNFINNINYQSNSSGNGFNNLIQDQLGFSVTKIDTSGNNSLCNATNEDLLLKVDSLKLLNLPISSSSVSNLQITQNTQIIINSPLRKITNVCLPLKKTKSKFFWTANNSNGFPTIVCKDAKLNIYDRSYNEPKTWHWIFPPQANVSDVDSFYLPNVRSISFNQAGIYPVSLVTENDAGIDTSTQYITVINFIPQPNLGNDTLLCAGDTLKIIYQNPANSLHYFTGPNIYTTSDTLKITVSGQYQIAAYTACGYLYDTIIVNFASKPKANFGFSNACNNLTVAFTDSSLLNFNPSITHQYAVKPALAPITAFTNYSTQPNHSYTFGSYDSFDVRLIIRSPLSCVQQDTMVKRIVLKAKPTQGFNATNAPANGGAGCGSLQATFASTATIAAGSIAVQEYYLGNTLIGNGIGFTYTFANYGSYVVKQVVKSNFGCVSDTAFVTVLIKAKPTVNIITVRDSVCLNNPYTLTANANVVGSAISNYTWLRNGTVLPNNTNTITDNLPTGTYTYKVVATAATTCASDTVTKIITVVSKPTATLSATNICGSKVVAISTSGSVINDNITAHFISYGDGNTSIANPNNTTYTYANYGTYNLKYVAKSSIGCASDTIPFTLVVKDKPTLSLSVVRDSVCLSNPYTLTANANVAASAISNYTWLRNGTVLPNNANTITDNLPTGRYTYKVVATAFNTCVSDTATKIITVVSKPGATLNATNICGSKVMSISTSGSVINDNITAHFISYGDGNTSIANPNNTTYTYANYGTYNLKYVAKSSIGCASDTIPFTIVVKDKPTLSIAYNPTNGGSCNNKNFTLTATAAVSASTITNYTWFKDGAILPSATNVLIQNNVAGTYVYKVVATANTGCVSDTAFQSVTVEQFPTTIFTAANGCVGKNILITNTSINPTTTGGAGNTGILLYTWATSDGQTSTSIIPNFSFATSGTKTIQLKTNTQNNCADSISKTITIDDFPTANFTITEACLGKKINIVNSSTPVSDYSWQSSNGQLSNAVVPDFIFNSVGNYNIKLTVTTANNCTSDVEKNFSIQAVQLFTKPAIDTNGVVNQPMQLSITGATNYLWSPNSNLQLAIGNSVIFSTATAGIYPLQIEGTTAQGCKGIANIKVNVFAANNYVWIPNAFTPNGDNLNDRLRITCSGLQSLTNFIIYNRYGEAVYTQNTCNAKGWDGTFKGILQPIGAFVYYWTGVDFRGKAVSGKGTVMLVR